MNITPEASSFRCTFLLSSDVHSALEAEKDKRVFDPIVTTNNYPSLKAQLKQKNLKPDTELGGVVRRSNYIATQRELGRPLVLDAGDFLSGSLWFRVLKGAVDVEVMNLMQYDAMAIGNHDFDLGWNHMKELAKKVEFTLLCSNIFEIDPESRKRKEDPIFEPYKIFEVEEGCRVAVVGIMGEGSWEAIGKDKKEQLKFRKPDKVLTELLKNLPPVDYTVLLSHSGIERDRKFAETYPQINAILGGHSHTLMDQGEKIGNTVILHPGPRGRVIAKLEVKGEQTQSSAEILDPSWDLPKDKMTETAIKIDTLLRENQTIVKEGFNQVVATCMEPVSAQNKKEKNSDLGKLLCEMLCGVENKADIAFIPSGSIRVAELEAGSITLEKVTNMVIDGPVWTITAKGEWVENMMAEAEKRWGGPSKQFQYGGIVKSPEGGFLIRGQPLEKDRWYQIRGLKFFFERENRPEQLVQKECVEHDETFSEMIAMAFGEKKEIE